MFKRLSAILFLLPLKFIQNSIMINKSLKWSAAHQVRGFLILIFGFTGVFFAKLCFLCRRSWSHVETPP